jgi:hypothetical protein
MTTYKPARLLHDAFTPQPTAKLRGRACRGRQLTERDEAMQLDQVTAGPRTLYDKI